MGNGHTPSRNDSSDETNGQEQDATKPDREMAVNSVNGHRRNLSGSLSSFSFLRSSQSSEDGSSARSTAPVAEEPPPSPRSRGAMAAVAQQKSMRKRKGSLRKTALLGTGKLRMDGRERRGSHLEEVKNLEGEQSDGSGTDPGTLSAPMSPATAVGMSTPRPLPVPPPVPMVTHPVHGDPSKISASSTNENKFFQNIQRPSTAQSTASTTDEDDLPPSPTGLQIPLAKTPLSTDSYFPLQPHRLLPRPRQTTPKSKSPLATLPPSVPSSPPSEWDYSETRWWGWIILMVTWIVFVVGMGSCFEVWSWAWDVGETPYAPPELEDDPTLPIVGYYPALIILTSVMAWVWVTVAWVGMKYFKHANISGDEEDLAAKSGD